MIHTVRILTKSSENKCRCKAIILIKTKIRTKDSITWPTLVSFTINSLNNNKSLSNNHSLYLSSKKDTTCHKRYKNCKNIMRTIWRKSLKEDKCSHTTHAGEKHQNFMWQQRQMRYKNMVRNQLSKNIFSEY